MYHALTKSAAALSLTLTLAACSSSPVSEPLSDSGEQVPTSIGPTRRDIASEAGSGLSGDFAYHAALRDFIRHMVSTHGFSERYLNELFSQAQRLDFVIRLETRPALGPVRPGGWSRYRSLFLTDKRIDDGVRFWAAHAHTVRRATETYGVDPEYIVAVIGVETFYGQYAGRTRVFDALTTLALETPRRSRFFTGELENFLLMAREQGYDPRSPVGSWAGAMGLGQFMPSSFRRLAVDFDQDGQRDLWDTEDAIGSVANYLARNGWQLGGVVAERAGSASGDDTVALSTYHGDEYWRTYQNFYVVKRYNPSNQYAMAVHQLAQAIKNRYLGLELAMQR
jgi:membrane-bound lytic murein transglycosylase B